MKKDYVPVLIVTFFMAWSPLLVKILLNYFDAYTQNFYRYLSASIFLMFSVFFFYRKKFFKAIKNIKTFILPAFIVFVFQTTWVNAINFLTPTIAALLIRSNILFITLFSFLMFKDEKNIIKTKHFIFGALLAIVGVTGIIIGRNKLQINHFNLGILLMILAAIIWSLYIMSIKKLVRKTDPLIASAFVFTIATIFLLPLSIFFGNLSSIFTVSKGILALLLFSGLFCVGVANTFNYKSIKIIGASVSSYFALLSPFLTAVFSYFLVKERLTIHQFLFGIVLIIGCALIVMARENTIKKQETITQ